MHRRLIFGLIVLNVVIALVLFAAPALTQILPGAREDCCEYGAPEPYCCNDCCWFRQDCTDDDDCTTSLHRSSD